jgi:hypothetical protein
MKNTISHLMSGLMLSLILSSCSSKSYANLLSKPLRERTLRIDPVTLDRFVYCGDYCEKYFAGICWSKWKQICDYEEFLNKDKMKALSDAEMVLKAREKP